MHEDHETDVAEAKRALRRDVRAARTRRSESERTADAEAIARLMITVVEQHRARTVACYLSMPGEPDTRGFLHWASEHGIRVLLPVIRADGLLDWAEHDGSETLEETLGVPEPTGPVLPPSAIDDVDLMFVPATAAGRDGSRLGGGRGFFDKTLACMQESPLVYAIVHDLELYDTVPHAAFDYPVDGVITPSGIHTSRS